MLTDEHALLLSQVASRAEDVLRVTDEDRWPGRELQSLLGYLRAEVLHQAADEEVLLFPAHDAPPGFARLTRDHVRLRAGIDVLDRAAASETTRSPARLAVTVRDVVGQLERHLAAEEEALAAARTPDQTPATVTLTHRSHEWYPLTEGTVIDLDALPPDQVVDAAVDRLLRLRRGEQVELHSGSDPHLVWRRMDDLIPGSYDFAYLQDGPRRWRMQVTRRPAT